MATDEEVTGNAGLGSGGEGVPAAWSGFRRLRVVDVVHETPTVTSLRLRAADGEPLAGAVARQFVVLRLALAAGQPSASRSYSLSGPPGSTEYRLSVKREPHGAFSAV